MAEDRSVILLGYRGSGKTTVGRRLAERLGCAFVDSDAELVRRFDGRSIRTIWATDGEPAFREVEADVVTELVARTGHVVALGGGAVTERPRARDAVTVSPGLKVYLHAPVEVLAGRIAADEETHGARPSLTGQTDALGEIAVVLAEREPVYRAVADDVVDVADLGVDAVVERIAAALNDAQRGID